MKMLRAYDSRSRAVEEFHKFVRLHGYFLDSSKERPLICQYRNGVRVYFEYFTNKNDVQKIAGQEFQMVDFYGFFTDNVEQYIMSRLRGALK